MSALPVPQRQLFDALEAIASGAGDETMLTEGTRRALLDFGSETPDNRDCVGRIAVGKVGAETGLKLAARPVLLSDIAHALEEAATPEAVLAAFPELSEEEWGAFCRTVTLLLSLIERRSDQPAP